MSRLKKMLATVGGAAIAAVALSAAGWPDQQARAQVASNHVDSLALDSRPANADNRSAFQPGSGQVVVDWDNELLKIE
jgi:hypothetical protein